MHARTTGWQGLRITAVLPPFTAAYVCHSYILIVHVRSTRYTGCCEYCAALGNIQEHHGRLEPAPTLDGQLQLRAFRARVARLTDPALKAAAFQAD
jgi:hypothetical protein